jgi:hypothetical protein
VSAAFFPFFLSPSSPMPVGQYFPVEVFSPSGIIRKKKKQDVIDNLLKSKN